MNGTSHLELREELKQLKICVIVPTYNNHVTLLQVLKRLLPYAADVIVVNDGSTDDTHESIQSFAKQCNLCGQTMLKIVSYSKNRGKGYALRCGFRMAQELGFRYAITIDSDGQHYPEDLPAFVGHLKSCLEKGCQHVLIVGNRKFQQKNMPSGNTFANYFSNFWFALQTWQYLPDTQSGYRLYPLDSLYCLNLITARYEAELEILVSAAWHGVRLESEPIRVFYPPKCERVTHFRPFWDFVRIFVLNTILCLLCFVYGWWAMLVRKVNNNI